MMELFGTDLSGSPNCKMWISMMVPDGVEHEVVKCGMCIVMDINDLRKEN